MLPRVGSHTRALSTQDKCDPLRSQRFFKFSGHFAGETNSPEPGLGDFLQCPGKVDHPDPWNALQGAGSAERFALIDAG